MIIAIIFIIIILFFYAMFQFFYTNIAHNMNEDFKMRERIHDAWDEHYLEQEKEEREEAAKAHNKITTTEQG